MTVFWGYSISCISIFLKPFKTRQEKLVLTYRCCFLQTLMHHLRHLCQHLPGSANRWKTLIIWLVFPLCPSSFKYNCTELDESASGPPKASASLPKQKGESSHLSPESMPRVSALPQGFRLSDDL